ncbi:MAG: ABC transporter ATP-binding protein [Chloroflexi bacterium]|nr:ABC transporter ATP-binding protein [Chloroflexota bacterium]
MTDTILQATHLKKEFGGVIAVNNVSFDVLRGEIFAVIGPNGAGKTTLFNLISGAYTPTTGEIRFAGKPLDRARPHTRTKLGMARTFQNLRLFNNMSVLENVMVGRHARSRYGILEAALRLPTATREENAIRDAAMQCVARVGLAERANELVGNLSFGGQRLVEIARAVATEPKLLLLDEPGAGLTRHEVEGLDTLIHDLRRDGMTVILVEHNMELVMGIADRVMVLDYGQKIAEGTPPQIQQNKRVIAAYLGEEPFPALRMEAHDDATSS